MTADPAAYARSRTCSATSPEPEGLDRLELIPFLQLAQPFRVHHGALVYLLGMATRCASRQPRCTSRTTPTRRAGTSCCTWWARATSQPRRRSQSWSHGPRGLPVRANIWTAGAAAGLRQADRPKRCLPNFARVAKVTGIPRHVGPHSLRHAAITNALDAGSRCLSAAAPPHQHDGEPRQTWTVRATAAASERRLGRICAHGGCVFRPVLAPPPSKMTQRRGHGRSDSAGLAASSRRPVRHYVVSTGVVTYDAHGHGQHAPPCTRWGRVTRHFPTRGRPEGQPLRPRPQGMPTTHRGTRLHPRRRGTAEKRLGWRQTRPTPLSITGPRRRGLPGPGATVGSGAGLGR